MFAFETRHRGLGILKPLCLTFCPLGHLLLLFDSELEESELVPFSLEEELSDSCFRAPGIEVEDLERLSVT